MHTGCTSSIWQIDSSPTPPEYQSQPPRRTFSQAVEKPSRWMSLTLYKSFTHAQNLERKRALAGLFPLFQQPVQLREVV